MNMRNEIRHAFDKVHAPDELVERMKQELYQKDFHEELDEVVCEVAEAPRRHILRYVMYTAASLTLCIVCGFSVWSLRDHPNPINPGSQVVSTPTENTTEPTTEDALAAELKQQENEKDHQARAIAENSANTSETKTK